MRWRDRPEVLAWWTLAESDLRVARVVMQLQPPEWRIACFHAQQAGEKALKALMEAMGRPVPRSHDLTLLVQLVAGADVSMELVDATARLSLHGVGPRYPGPSGEATGPDASESVVDAEQVLQWVLDRLERADAG